MSEYFERFFPSEFQNFLILRHVQSVNKSINVKFVGPVGHHCAARPGAPTVVSGQHDQKVHCWVVFWMQATGVSNVVKVERVFQTAGPE